MSKKPRSSTTKKRDPARDLKGAKRWETAPRHPLADFFHPRPQHVVGITEIRGPREVALRQWLLACPDEGVLVIHRTMCRLGKSSNASGVCDCSPTYLTMGACA